MKKIIVATVLLSFYTFTAFCQGNKEDAARKAEFVQHVLAEQGYLSAQIVDKLFTYNITPSMWDMFTAAHPTTNDNDGGLQATKYLVMDVVNYARRLKIEHFDQLEINDEAVHHADKPLIDEAVKLLKEKFSLTINDPAIATSKSYEMFLRFPYQTMVRLGSTNPEWQPVGGVAKFVVMLSPTVKDMSVKKTDNTYTITGPTSAEAYDTQSKIQKGLDLYNANN